MQNCTLSLSRYDLGVASWIYSCFQELSWWMDSPYFRFVDLCGPSGLSLSKQALAASDQQGVPLAGRLLWFFSHTYLLRPVFLWRTVLGSGSHEGGLQPQWESLAGSYSSAFWQTSLSHLTVHPKQRPEENNRKHYNKKFSTISGNADSSCLTTICTGGSPLRRLSGASRGETNGFFIIGVQGICISTRHLDRRGSKFSG